MTPPPLTDAHGNRYAPVHVDDLEDWADLVGLIEDWLLHASDETLAELADFGPTRRPVDPLIRDLGALCVRLRRLAHRGAGHP